MENLEWYPVLYNRLETNIEVTRCGRVRRVKKEWLNATLKKFKIGEVDFDKLKLGRGYKIVGVQIKGLKAKTARVQQLVASVFLGYKFQGHKLVVDHIDSNKLNNNLNNLRLISNRENLSKERTIKSGLPTGVSFYKPNKKYRATIVINNKQNYLGYFKTPEEASEAYQNKLNSIKKY